MVKKRELKNVTITHVSYCKQAKNNRQFFLSKSEISGAMDMEFNVAFINKADTSPSKLLYGIVYEPGVADRDGDFMSEEQIEKAAHEYMQHYRNIDLEHDLHAGKGDVVQSYIALSDMEFDGAKIKKGSWILVTKADDEMWDAWKSGEITGYSMKGIAREVVITKGEPMEKSFLRKALEFVGISKSFDETVQERIDDLSKSHSFIMDMISSDFYKNIVWDFSKTAELEALSTTLKEAAAYVDAKIAENDVSKSQKEPETQEPVVKAEEPVEPATQTEDTKAQITEPDSAKEPENPSADEPIAEPVEPTEPEIEAGIQKSEDVQKAELLSAMQTIIDKSLTPILEKVETLNNQIQIIQTGSKVVVEKASSVAVQRTAGATLLS